MVLFATDSHYVLLPSSGKRKALKQSSEESVLPGYQYVNITDVAWLQLLSLFLLLKDSIVN